MHWTLLRENLDRPPEFVPATSNRVFNVIMSDTAGCAADIDLFGD